MLHAFLLLASSGSTSEGPEKVVDRAQQLMDTAVTFVSEKGMDLAISLVAAIAIFVIGKWVVKLLTRLAGKLMDRAKVDETISKFLCNILHSLLLVIVCLTALEQLGVDTTSFAAIIAAAGLAVGFALQGSLSNFAAGVMLIMFKPFKVGDFVDAGGSVGVVEEIQIINTFIRTPDNVQVIVPNSQITGGTISNYTSKPTRRVDLVFGCGYTDDLKAVKTYLEEVVAAHPKVLQDPAPDVMVGELADNSVNFNVRPWVKSEDYWDVRFDLTEKIKLGFDEKGFNIPFPQRDVHLHQVS